MNNQKFNEMSVIDVKNYITEHGLKELNKSGIFYHGFFESGYLYPNFKEKLSILVEFGLNINELICKRWGEKRAPIFEVLSGFGREMASAIKVLAEFGADINLPDNDGRTPIMVACTGRYQGDLSKPSVVKALIKAGADLSLQDSKGNLVTDLADHKSLPALVAAGAPFNVRKSRALWIAVWGKDLELTRDLLLKGLKKGLSSWELEVRLPFLQTIAQTYPDLFQKGFSLEDTKRSPADKKAVKAFKALRDMCDAEPKSNSSSASSDNALPLSLRPGGWPPQKPEPTAPISTQPPSPRAPEFRFPPVLLAACAEICEPEADERSATKSRSDFSKFISVIDEILTDIENTNWAAETEKFIQDPIPSVYKETASSRFSRVSEFLRHHEETAFNAFYIQTWGLDNRNGPFSITRMRRSNTFQHSVSINTQIAMIGSLNLRIWSNDENLLKDKSFISYAKKIQNILLIERKVDIGLNFKEIGSLDIEDIKKYLEIFQSVRLKWTSRRPEKIHYCALAYRIGPSISEALQLIARGGDVNALDCLSHLNDASLAPLMAESLSLPDKFKYAQSWFRNFPETAIDGLLECSFCDDIAARRNAQQALRFIAAGGWRQNILDQSLRFGEPANVATVEFLGHDARADFLPRKMPKLPAYFVSSAHPAPTLKCSGEALPAHAIDALARMMLVSTCHVQTPAISEVMEACDPQSLADFALSVCEAWAKNGSKKDGIGFQHALGYLGDTRSALLLAKWYKNYPFNADTQGGIEVLGVLGLRGSNTAIAGLQAIARFSKYDKAIVKAKQVLEAVAFSRGLTPTLLEDLAIPDLGLDSNSQMTLDFGPRRFSVTLDSNLDAVLTDEIGNILKALPKPVKADDANKAKAATAQWKEFKAALKVQASDQKKRFEQAMLIRREWDGATFKEVVANHPLLSKMVCSLVWASVNGEVPDTAFRVDADARYFNADGAEFLLADDARVILPHPVHLGGSVEIWLQIFAENKLTQPFPQLARKWFAEGAETERLIRARDGTKVPLGSLRGLKAKGWEFEEGGAGMVWSVYKFDEGARASIDVEPGWSLSGFDYEDFGGDQTVKLDVSGSDPIAYSELVRDFLSLPIATGEEP